ncbi:MAG: hypothetical protein V2I33_19225, partial [Kangiellaceae bacterium]|nr:hypothetical protein [Kangiellaceae bacterium]
MVAVLLITVGTVLKFSRALEDIPVGCDEFGYLQLAESLEEGTEFGDHRERTYFQPLFDTLVESGFEPHEFTWMITPHAYHYDSDSKKIINQYAPGTSFVLSLFPKNFRQRAFPALILLLWFFVPYLLVWMFRDRSTANGLGIYLLLLFPLLTLHPSLSVEL